MNKLPSQAKYADLLSRTSGKLFQTEVAVLHVKNGIAFQTIPTAPSGDGGLDGLSNNQSVGYCCYGLELNAAPVKSRAQIRQDICDKFKQDLRRIFELQHDNKKGGGKKKGVRLLKHAPNAEIAGIIASPNKLKRIVLICNWFDDNKIVGTINAAFDLYKKASQRQYVDDACELVILGPTELASMFTIDEYLLARLEHPELIAVLEGKATAPSSVPAATKLDAKFTALAASFPGAKETVNQMRDDFFRLWCEHIAKMEDLNNTLPDVHRRVLAVRDRAARTANMKSLTASAASAHKLIEEVEQQITAELKGVLPQGYPEQFAGLIVSDLLGNCPLGWS